MKRKMLINAQRPEEVRVAVVADVTLDAYRVAIARSGQMRGNIYRGVVASIQPSLDAAFVDFGEPKHGFLPGDEVMPQAAHHTAGGGGRQRVEKLLERGRPLLVQVSKEPGGEKGAALTTNISLAGRYLVFMPLEEARGVSRKVEDEEVRRELRDLAEKLDVPPGSGVIVRTAALGQSKIALGRDLAALVRLWKKIQSEGKKGKGPRLLYSDQDLIVQAVRDTLDASIDEVLVDDDAAFAKVEAAMRSFMPRSKTGLVRYRERVPLFSRFGLEAQIESIFKAAVPLPAGGSIVIERTEALTAVDVNSGRATKAASNEETYLRTNLEAAREVARQLRLRDIGGLIVVDFIDMRSPRHRRDVEKALRDALKVDRARVDVGKISRNGLLEINRQRLGTPLEMRTHRPCPTCAGTGSIPSPETVSLSLLRRIEERAATSSLAAVRVALHPELADAFQNTQRQALAALEREFDLRIEVVAATHLHRSQEEVSWTARDRSHAAAPVAAVAVTDLTAALPETGDSEEQKTGGKSKRRRRGGRKHRKSVGPAESLAADTGETVVAAAEPEEAPTPEPPPAPAAGAENEDESDPTGAGASATSKRRRRGGRRHRKSKPVTAGSAAATEPGPPPENPALPPAEATELSAEGTAKKRKRRRRRPSRKADAGGETVPEVPSAE